jgi:hypothetical protein
MQQLQCTAALYTCAPNALIKGFRVCLRAGCHYEGLCCKKINQQGQQYKEGAHGGNQGRLLEKPTASETLNFVFVCACCVRVWGLLKHFPMVNACIQDRLGYCSSFLIQVTACQEIALCQLNCERVKKMLPGHCW